ncbi:hypothetical protein Hamer_G006529 [Homarus americanus]|uniref:Uncharacterized protein n=1 Tax=Homarus americanus TaxID=6706 RepID=A0A8J5JLI8_HOMAM|nr:hypothetical protein Hamer_G006529 [Homarus americanus]
MTFSCTTTTTTTRFLCLAFIVSFSLCLGVSSSPVPEGQGRFITSESPSDDPSNLLNILTNLNLFSSPANPNPTIVVPPSLEGFASQFVDGSTDCPTGQSCVIAASFQPNTGLVSFFQSLCPTCG